MNLLIPASSLLLASFLSFNTQAQAVTEYIHTDALGSPVAVTDASGNIVEREVYEPYGSPITRPPSDQPGFTGHVADSLTGLTYMQQRYYDPQIGRFLSVDPVTAHSNPVGAFNRYWYANNNPYRFTDPDGRQVKENDKPAPEPTELAEVKVTASRPIPQTLSGITVTPPRPVHEQQASPQPNAPSTSTSTSTSIDCPEYGERYMRHLDGYLINVGPYAGALLGGLWPKSLSPATGGRGPLLGSRNPLTSVPRGFGVPGAGSTAVRSGSAAIGVATVAVGFYNVGVFGSGLAYAGPSYPGCN